MQKLNLVQIESVAGGELQCCYCTSRGMTGNDYGITAIVANTGCYVQCCPASLGYCIEPVGAKGCDIDGVRERNITCQLCPPPTFNIGLSIEEVKEMSFG